jgi:hypothetical protein
MDTERQMGNGRHRLDELTSEPVPAKDLILETVRGRASMRIIR